MKSYYWMIMKWIFQLMYRNTIKRSTNTCHSRCTSTLRHESTHLETKQSIFLVSIFETKIQLEKNSCINKTKNTNELPKVLFRGSYVCLLVWFNMYISYWNMILLQIWSRCPYSDKLASVQSIQKNENMSMLQKLLKLL